MSPKHGIIPVYKPKEPWGEIPLGSQQKKTRFRDWQAGTFAPQLKQLYLVELVSQTLKLYIVDDTPGTIFVDQLVWLDGLQVAGTCILICMNTIPL